MSGFSFTPRLRISFTLPEMSVSGVRISWDMLVKNFIFRSDICCSIATFCFSCRMVVNTYVVAPTAITAMMRYSSHAQPVCQNEGSTSMLTSRTLSTHTPSLFVERIFSVYLPGGRLLYMALWRLPIMFHPASMPSII